MKKLHLSLQMKFLLSIILIVVPILGVIFTYASIQNEKQALEEMLNQARILSMQIILTRQWVTDCGGIMVSRESEGAKGIAYFLDDRLKTSRGTFQRFSPAMVTKKLSQYSENQNLYRFHLASLTPLNPKNRANDFEKEVLNKFDNEGLTEMIGFNKEGKTHLLHYMVPLYVEKGCLECHNNQQISRNGIRGGLSVLLPIDKMKASIGKSNLNLAVSGIGLILLTIFTLFFLLRHVVIKPLKALEGMTSEIGRGNLDSRVDINTGDEFEKLGHAFNDMTERISKGRGFLEEKIALATQELSEANRELKKLDKLKTEFIADMSHELRSPVTVIQGGLDYLKRKIKKEDNKNYLTIIDNNLLRLTHLISDMLDLTRIEAGKVVWSFEQYDMAALIREVIEILGLRAHEKTITLDFQHQGQVWTDMDLERIEQVLVNLIENAIKFSKPESEIVIETRLEEQRVHVSVQDYGIGIAAKDHETIFKKFHTLPSSSGSGRAKGTGLGLTISKKIIEAHNGRIWAESTEGQGSVFRFVIPQKQSA